MTRPTSQVYTSKATIGALRSPTFLDPRLPLIYGMSTVETSELVIRPTYHDDEKAYAPCLKMIS
ncbi:hypothetical protein N7530_008285 [Penicillium desertorum]|uniref:Uncharacterized protein n=1 Tax=Penicillium desertorum TaxID=1303715 RepID=A0A9W9WPE6_9EURO|nr:hypothetical protein N7530_008285 [Penicillium desertorum]